MTTARNLSVEIRYHKLKVNFNYCFKHGIFQNQVYNFFLCYFLGRFVQQFYRKICLFFLSEFLVIRMFVKNSILALQILESNCMSLRDPHCTNLDRHCCICGNLLGKKKMAKEKYIIHLNSVLFINITKDLQYYILQDMHEMLPSYEYGLEKKYIAPYFT